MTLGRRRLAAAVLVVLTAGLTPGLEAVASATAPQPPDGGASVEVHAKHPQLEKLLPGPMKGKAALKALDAAGKRAAAAENGTTVAGLTAKISADDTVGLGPTGRIFFAEAATAQEAQTAASTSAAPSWSVQPNSQAFLLHSKPGSKHTVYLDFDGYTLPPGTGWQGSPGIPSGTYGGFTADGSGTFTDDELTYIQTVWRFIAEKYAPFDIDVTTQTPAAGALDYTGSGDDTWGSRAVITSDMNARGTACTANNFGGCLGIAYINTFNAPEPSPGYYEPAWVYTKFTSGTETLSAGQVANAAAHEIGHNLGLDHDATVDADYYGGNGNWFPIMGSGVLAVGQFSRGDYPDAVTGSFQKNNNPDDVAVIASAGAPLRTDDVGGTTATATTLAAGTSTLGIIGTRTDVDVFKVVTTCQGDLTAAATGIGDGQAVDLKVSILNSGGSVLTSADPTSDQDVESPLPLTPTGLDATATQASAAAATYYVSLDGVGKGTFANGGYDDYGSIGQYQLAVTGCVAGQPVAPSVPTSLVATPGVHTTTGSISWSPPADPGTSAVTSYTVSGVPGGPYVVNAPATSKSLTGLVPGTTYTVSVTASSSAGTSAAATKSIKVLTWAPTAAPGVVVSTHTSSVDVDWTPPANPGNSTPTGWHVALFDAGHNTLTSGSYSLATTGVTFSSVPRGTYSVEVYQEVTSNDGTKSATASKGFKLGPSVPSAPKIGTPSSGASGGSVNAIARWGAPTSNGGSAITGYRVYAYRLSSTGAVLSSKYSTMRSAASRSYTFPLAAGRYKFRVVAYNAVGRSSYSAYSTAVYAR